MKVKYNVIANFIGQFYVMTVGILALPYYLKYLGSEAYGLVAFFTMLTSMMMLLDAGIIPTVTRESARLNNDKAKLKSTIRVIEYFLLPITLITAFGVYFLSGKLTNNWVDFATLDFSSVENSIKIMGFIIAIRWFGSVYQGVLMGLEYQVWVNSYKIVISTFRTIVALLLIVYINDDITTYFLYQLLVAIAELLAVMLKTYLALGIKYKAKPSFQILREMLPFIFSTGFTTISWTLYIQFDKLLLSSFLNLAEYGYYVIVVVLAGAVMKFSTPFTQAMLPKMTSLKSKNDIVGFNKFYRKGTRTVAMLIIPITAMMSFYSSELLYSWTGNMELANWGDGILKWYVLGTGLAALNIFQYYIQYASGNLRFHVLYNTILPLVGVPSLYFIIHLNGAQGAAYFWFFVHFSTFLIWNKIVHDKFIPGLHYQWLFRDILPYTLVTSACILLFNLVNIEFFSYSQFEIFVLLIFLGLINLLLNLAVYFFTTKKALI
ncbi:hypothetical protein PESP_a0481 [Pseudoalteromonas espejiana DSM 9414]|uniref:Polysaccharide biosynthesis protein n=1 Tax=Pseudoalteromonas espejiana TaxID=28107 RepID=A0A510Y0Y8_9GAMM|nr:oligosaccharide flippase family protein [Pseudoalteromonas espejiana]ASM48726.1 hypothetical protein PESP_a0481 [Pseudoalteromonas espejiana DSM 9414]GEK56995.1 polysaccharide biosynthesis protein [Pseudoalteromonas espejiana]